MKKKLSRNKKILFSVAAFLISSAFCLIVGELTLYYLEKNRFDYGDVLKSDLGRGGFLKENFDSFVVGGYRGSKVLWKNNSDGFRSNREFSEKPEAGVLRILSIGDSFTAGYRVGQDETFSFLLGKWLNSIKIKSEILIADIEEPATGLNYLKRFGQLYEPHIVILGITIGNDIAQSYISLNPEGTGFTKGLDKYEIPEQCLTKTNLSVKISSFIAQWQRRFRILSLLPYQSQAIASWYGEYERPKLFDVINGLGVYLKAPNPEIDKAYRRLFRILLRYRDFSKENGIQFVAALFPQRFQVQPDDWQKTIKAYRLKESCFDTQFPNIRINKFCRENSMNCIDPTEEMAEKFRRNKTSLYFARGDMHWNRFGHKAFFESSRDSIYKLVEPALK